MSYAPSVPTCSPCRSIPILSPFRLGKLVCLNIDPWEIGKNHAVDVAILGDPKATLAELLPMLQERLGGTRHAESRARIAALQQAKTDALGGSRNALLRR